MHRGIRATLPFLISTLFFTILKSAAAADDAPRLSPAFAGRLAAVACTVGISYELDGALLPATRDDALPDGYEPADLISLAGTGIPQWGPQQLRSLIIPDALTMTQAAHVDGIQLAVSSGYRSHGTQAATYRYWVSVRGPEQADRVSARPGHSQHQLGTAIDFNFGSLGGFAASPAGIWLWDHAHEFGFVFPYTPAGVARSGYISEPWHVRWVGRELATLMWEEDYQHSDTLIADDYVALARDSLRGLAQAGPAVCATARSA